MLIGGTQVLVNHPLVIIGTSGLMDDYVELPVDSWTPGAVAHFGVSVRPQFSLVRIRLWLGECPTLGQTIFDNEIVLPNGDIAIFDVENSFRYLRTLGGEGIFRIRINANVEKLATLVDVVVNAHENGSPIIFAGPR